MVKVIFWRVNGREFTGFEVTGHAGYSAKGDDIVCAAVSALAQTGVLSLKEQLQHKPEVIIRDGYLRCQLPAEMESADYATAQVILKTVEIGLKAISVDYSKYVKLQYTASE